MLKKVSTLTCYLLLFFLYLNLFSNINLFKLLDPRIKDQMALRHEFMNFIKSEPTDLSPTYEAGFIQKTVAPPQIPRIKNINMFQANNLAVVR